MAGLPKEYAIIRTFILAKESSNTLKEFRAQLLGVEKEIEGDTNLLSQNLFTMYMNGYGSSSNSGTSSSSIYGSTSNPQNHSHIPATITGVITQVPYLNPQQPEYLVLPQFYPMPQQPVPFYPPPFGYGFAGNMRGFSSSGSNSQQSNMNRVQYGPRNFNGSKRQNNYINNGGYKGKNFKQNGNSS